MIRIFKIKNADGDVLDLTTIGELFLYDVEGLGYETDPKSQRVGNSYTILSNYLKQGEIDGVVKFWNPNAYQNYFDFAQFCQDGTITLIYEHDAGTFYRDGVISKVGKAESNSGVLISDITFTAKSLFYKKVWEYNEGGAGDGKRYIYQYPYRYAGSAPQSVVIESDSRSDCPTKIEIYGPAEYPTWRHYLNNELVATGGVNAIIEDGRKLIIDTTTIPYRIIQTDLANNLISDLYQQSNFETVRFIRLGHGRNVISVAQQGAGIVKLGVEARIEYATV